MAKSQETFNKKEKEKKRLQKKQEKEEKREERKAQKKERGADDMIAYVDEYGNFSSTPPDPMKKRQTVKAEDIQIGVAKQEEMEVPAVRRGKVSFFNDAKGYGFIKELDSQESFFVHINDISEPIKENDKVTFEIAKGPKGFNAVQVKKDV